MTRTILIVDDEEQVQRLFEQRFRREKRRQLLDLQFAFSGAEALQYLQQKGAEGLALILSDINMPRMSGLQLLDHIRRQYPGLKVILVTAYDDPDHRQKARELGADDYLTKPIDFEALKQIILEH